jgi:prophage regulatory protein
MPPKVETKWRKSMSSTRLLRRKAVEAKIGLKTSALYAAMAKGFPKPVRIGERAVAWVEGEVDAWIARRLAERDRELHREMRKQT